jgi:hypothetical protein
VVLLMLLSPALYYLDLADAYLSWCVYSSNQPQATLYAPLAENRVDDAIHAGKPLAPATLAEVLEFAVGEDLAFKHFDSINAPFSPAPRLYEQYFRRVGQPGEMLVIDDPRPIAEWRGRRRTVLVMTYDRMVRRW